MSQRRFRWPDPPLGDDTIVLRPWQLDDAEALVAAWHDPAVAAMGSIPATPTVAFATRWIAASEQRLATGTAIDLVVADRDDRVLGEVGAVPSPEHAHQAEIGYWVGAAHRNRGLASRAVRIFVEWLLSPTGAGLVRVAAQVDPSNRASVRVLERTGFGLSADGPGETAIYVRGGTENLCS